MLSFLKEASGLSWNLINLMLPHISLLLLLQQDIECFSLQLKSSHILLQNQIKVANNEIFTIALKCFTTVTTV